MSVLIGGSCATLSPGGGAVFPLPNEEEEEEAATVLETGVEPSPASGAAVTTDPGFPASSFFAGLPVALPPGPAAVGLDTVDGPGLGICDPFSGFLDAPFGLTAV